MNGQSTHVSVLDEPPSGQAQGDQLSPELVSSLLEKFYSRSGLPPLEIAKINTLLVQVQARNTSLELPERLLQSSSSQVRFFAAVLLGELTKKLPESASAEKKALLADKYVQYVVYGINSGFGAVEFAKLSRACAGMYVAIREWPDCFRQLMHRLFGDGIAEFDRLSRLDRAAQKSQEPVPAHLTDQGFRQLVSNEGGNPLQSLIDGFNDAKTFSLITFMGSLIESLDPDTIDLPEIDKVKVNESFISTCQSLIPVVSALMNKESIQRIRHSPATLLALILNHKMFQTSSSITEVQNKVEYLAQSLWIQSLSKMNGSDGIFWTNYESVVASVFRFHKAWVSKDTLNALLDHAVEPDSGLLAHASRAVETQEQLEQQLSARRMCKEIALQAVEARLIETDRAPAFLRLAEYMAMSFVIDESCEWAGQVVLFWTDYAEILQTDYRVESNDADRSMLIQLLQPMLLAMTFIYPRLTVPEDPDDELRDHLVDIQQDMHSLFAQAYLLFNDNFDQTQGVNPVPAVIMQTEAQFSQYGLASPELIMRTLSGVAEYMIPHPTNDPAVCRVLETRLFEPLRDSYDMVVPLKSREVDASIEFLEKYAPMLARNSQYLIRAVGFLFSILDTDMNAHDPEIGQAMKAICLAGRTQLIPDFQNLVNRYQDLQNQGIYFPEAKVDVIAALGIVGYAADLEKQNLDAISTVISIIQEEVEQFLSLPDPEEDAFEQDGLDCLRSILELGSLVRSGSSRATAILLDDDNGKGRERNRDENIVSQAAALQKLVTDIMSTLAGCVLLRNNEDALHAIWDILRLSQNGKSETDHMAIFTFGPDIYVEVLGLCVSRGVAADYGLDTFGSMIVAKYNRDADQELRMLARKGFAICMQYMGACSQVDDGGDSMNGPLKLLLGYLLHCDDIVREIAADFPRIAEMITPAIGSSNLFTQEAACEVWRTVLRSNGPLLDHISQMQLQDLALAVVLQISGEALERALPSLSEVLAAMGSRGGPCKGALEGAFRHLESQGMKVANWTRFVQQIFILRGGQADTKRVTEQFWRADKLAKAQIDIEEESEGEVDIVVLDD